MYRLLSRVSTLSTVFAPLSLGYVYVSLENEYKNITEVACIMGGGCKPRELGSAGAGRWVTVIVSETYVKQLQAHENCVHLRGLGHFAWVTVDSQIESTCDFAASAKIS